jgi:FkbM family methyltransferase
VVEGSEPQARPDDERRRLAHKRRRIQREGTARADERTASLLAAVAHAVRRWNRPRVYTARHGIARGLKQIGGIRLVLPGFLQQAPEYPEFAGLEEAFLRELDYEGQTIYDVGAFQGILTLFFAQQAGDRGRVIAFEPHPANYERVVENVKLNDFSNVTIRNIGLGRARGELELMAPAEGLAGRASASEDIKRAFESQGLDINVFTVPVNSLDEEIADSSLPDPDFVKIDVEGLELDVLQGMKETIARYKPRLFLEIHGAGAEAKRSNAARVVGFLADRGYAMHHVETDQPVDSSTSERAMPGHLYCI